MKKPLVLRDVNCLPSVPLSIDLSVFLISEYFSALQASIKFTPTEKVHPRMYRDGWSPANARQNIPARQNTPARQSTFARLQLLTLNLSPPAPRSRKRDFSYHNFSYHNFS